MNLGKRKCDGDDDAEKNITTKKKITVPAEDDDEVEQFFAILRRIREAVKYFERASGSGRSLTPKPWEPSFQADDFEVDGDHRDGVNKDLTADSTSNSGLDLNSEPAPSRYNHATSSFG